MGCATGVVRIIVFVFNFLCALVGLTLLTVGTLYYISIEEYYNLTGNNYTLIPILVISVGAAVFFISFMGCCGVCQKSDCMLITYAVLLLALFVVQLTVGVIGFLQVKEHGGDFNKTFVPDIHRAFDKYAKNKEIETLVNSFQIGFKCCGVESYEDYEKISVDIPNSCCENATNGNKCSGSSAYRQGCAPKIFNMVISGLEVLTYVALGIAIVELVGSLFAVCLVNSIRNERRRGYN